MNLYNASVKARDSHTYTVMLPTWKANPDVTFKDLAPEFTADPVSAWRDLGCRPPYSAASFVNGINPFYEVTTGRLPIASQTTYVVMGRGGRRKFVSAHLKWRGTETEIPKLLALDAGRSKNSFGLTVVHLDSQRRVHYDLCVEVHPQPGIPVGYAQVYADVICPIVKNLNCVAVVSDRWQNYKITDDLENDYKLFVEEIRLNYGNFIEWRDDLLGGRFRMPRPECKSDGILHIEKPEEIAFDDRPTAQFIRQSLRVVDVPGKTVEKPTIGNDDVFRSAVLAHAATRSPEIALLLSPGDGRRKSGAIGALSSSTSGSSPRNSGIGVSSRLGT